MLKIVVLVVLIGVVLGKSSDERVYTFAVGNDDIPYEIKANNGMQMGLSIDIVRKVCEKAEKKCEFVTHKSYTDCWNTETLSAPGLSNRYWDVCATWYATSERNLVYSFFGEYSDEQPSYLYAATSTRFQSLDSVGHRVGFREAFWINSACLKGHGYNVEKPVLYKDWESLLNDLKSDRIDVAFINEDAVKGVDGLRKISPALKCAKKGISMMVRKEDLPDFAWFDPVLEDLMASKWFTWICNIAQIAYRGDPRCKK